MKVEERTSLLIKWKVDTQNMWTYIQITSIHIGAYVRLRVEGLSLPLSSSVPPFCVLSHDGKEARIVSLWSTILHQCFCCTPSWGDLTHCLQGCTLEWRPSPSKPQDIATWNSISKHEVLGIIKALEGTPFVPLKEKSRVSYLNGKYPIIHVGYIILSQE